MIAIGLGMVLGLAATVGYTPIWLPRSVEWLGGIVLLGIGYLAVMLRPHEYRTKLWKWR